MKLIYFIAIKQIKQFSKSARMKYFKNCSGNMNYNTLNRILLMGSANNKIFLIIRVPHHFQKMRSWYQALIYLFLLRVSSICEASHDKTIIKFRMLTNKIILVETISNKFCVHLIFWMKIIV